MVHEETAGDTALFNIFVMVPRTVKEGEFLKGYRIGHYPAKPLKNLDIYKQPPGFIQVTEELHNLKVSPRFTLGQFLCKQNSDFPKFLLLQERLLLKLEAIIDKLNEEGHPVTTLHVMSAYRTPHYNKAIGNVEYSMHQWGGAADIFVDESANGKMDDLNKDGIIDGKDSDILIDIVEQVVNHTNYLGGIGKYKANHAHGPFVHVDVRGSRATWGFTPITSLP